MKDVAEFLAYAIRLEQDAATRFDTLADAVSGQGNSEVAALFRKMAEFSRLHLALAKERGGFQDLPKLADEDFQWPDGESPEIVEWQAGDALFSVADAIDFALKGERRGHVFYQKVYETTADPEIKVMAKEFAEEEGEHVAQLEVWRARY